VLRGITDDHLGYCFGWGELIELIEKAHSNITTLSDLTGIRFLNSRKEFYQCGLTVTISANDANSVSVLNANR
jgi:hypothetical protein